MDTKTPTGPKLGSYNGHDWIVGMRAFLMSLNLWEVINLPRTVYRREDLWLNDLGQDNVAISTEPTEDPVDSVDTRRRKERAVGILIGHVSDELRDR